MQKSKIPLTSRKTSVDGYQIKETIHHVPGILSIHTATKPNFYENEETLIRSRKVKKKKKKANKKGDLTQKIFTIFDYPNEFIQGVSNRGKMLQLDIGISKSIETKYKIFWQSLKKEENYNTDQGADLNKAKIYGKDDEPKNQTVNNNLSRNYIEDIIDQEFVNIKTTNFSFIYIHDFFKTRTSHYYTTDYFGLGHIKNFLKYNKLSLLAKRKIFEVILNAVNFLLKEKLFYRVFRLQDIYIKKLIIDKNTKEIDEIELVFPGIGLLKASLMNVKQKTACMPLEYLKAIGTDSEVPPERGIHLFNLGCVFYKIIIGEELF